MLSGVVWCVLCGVVCCCVLCCVWCVLCVLLCVVLCVVCVVCVVVLCVVLCVVVCGVVLCGTRKPRVRSTSIVARWGHTKEETRHADDMHQVRGVEVTDTSPPQKNPPPESCLRTLTQPSQQ